MVQGNILLVVETLEHNKMIVNNIILLLYWFITFYLVEFCNILYENFLLFFYFFMFIVIYCKTCTYENISQLDVS